MHTYIKLTQVVNLGGSLLPASPHVAEPVLKHCLFSMLREKALKAAIGHVHYEDENTEYLCIACVEKVNN